MTEILHHLVSNDHNEWGMIAMFLSDQWPVLRAYIGRLRWPTN